MSQVNLLTAGRMVRRPRAGAAPWRRRRPLAQALAVFAQVCDAVAHAHQRGVIHRDLKPSNILVDEAGVPHVLDFGIAHLVDDLQARRADAWTVTGFAGTPAYASPEQLEASTEADTRTDVYSLGVLLYRVVTGTEAFGRNIPLPALIDAVREGTVRRPSAVCRTIPREFDWVVLKAMSREPAQRYQTVEALAADVRGFLKGEPVNAHPPSNMYAATKFVRRHTLASAATGAVLAVILALTGVAITQAVRVSRQNADLVLAVERETRARREADAERARADAHAAAQRGTVASLAGAVARMAERARLTPGERASVLSAIETEVARLPESEDPEARMQIHALRARIAGSTRRDEESFGHWGEAIRAADGVYAPGDARLAVMHREYANGLSKMKRHDEAVREATLALATTDPKQHLHSLRTRCTIQIAAGDLEGAAATGALLLDDAGTNHSNRSFALEVVSDIELARGRHTGARALLEEAIAEQVADGRDDSLPRLRVALANLLLREGRLEEAEAAAGWAVTARLARGEPMAARAGEALRAHAEALSRLGRFSEAAQRLELDLPRFEYNEGPGSRRLACHRFLLAGAYLGAGALAEGRRNLALAVSLEACNDADKPSVASDVRTCESAIIANRWQVNRALGEPLGPLAWLTEHAPDTPPDPARPGTDETDQ